MPEIRLARRADIAAVSAIYEKLHTAEENGKAVIGWLGGIELM